MSLIKQNVEAFNRDVAANSGYVYTSNQKYSSYVANLRQTQITIERLKGYQSALDIGCGDGTYTAEIKKAIPSINIVGTDAAKVAIDRAQSTYPDTKFAYSNILDPSSFPAEKYQIGVFRGVLHHLSDPALAIRLAGDIVDELLIIEPNGNNPILKVIEKTSKYHIEHEERSFSASTLRGWLKESGWKVEYMTYIGYVPFFFPTLPSKIIYFFQPLLEKVPFIRHFFSAQIVIHCTKAKSVTS